MPPLEPSHTTATATPSLSRSSGLPTAGDSLSRFRSGDREAFRVLESLLRPGLRRFCCRYLDVELAGEAYQETWIRVFRFAHRFDPARDATAWIFSIARRVCTDVQRREKVHRAIPETDAAPDGAFARAASEDRGPGYALEQRERLAGVRACLGELELRYREVVDLWLAELPHASIAGALDIPEGTSAWRLSVARRQLRECLNRKGLRLGAGEDGGARS